MAKDLNIGGMNVSIGVDTNKFDREMAAMVNRSKKAAKNLEKNYNELFISVKELKGILIGAKTRLFEQERALTALGKRTIQNRIAYDKLSRSIRLTKVDIKDLRLQIERTSFAQSEFATKTKSVGGILNRIGKNWASLAIRLAGYAVAFKALFVIKDAIKDLREFGRGMAYVNTIIKVSNDELKFMGKQVRILQTTLGVAQNELTDGLYQLVSAGVSAKNAITVLGAAAKASVGGFTTVKVAVDGLTSILNTYHISTKKAIAVFDIMFKTVKLGKITFAELANNYSKFAGVAEQLGVNFTDVSAAMATMTKQSGNSAQAATRLMAIFNGVLKGQDKARAMGIKVAEAFSLQALKAKGLQKFLQDLFIVLNGNTEALSKLFGRQRATLGMLQLVGDNAKVAAEQLMEIKNAAGETGKAYDIMADTMEKAFDRVTESFSVLATDILTEYTPVFIGFANFMSTMIKEPKRVAWFAGLLVSLGIVKVRLEEATKFLKAFNTYSVPTIPAVNTYDQPQPISDNIKNTLKTVREIGKEILGLIDKQKDTVFQSKDWWTIENKVLALEKSITREKIKQLEAQRERINLLRGESPEPSTQKDRYLSGEEKAKPLITGDEQKNAAEQTKILNDALFSTVNLTAMINGGFEEAGRSVASAFGNAINLFGQANSVLQQFLNTLIKTVAQMFIMAAIKFGLTAWNPFGLFAHSGGKFVGTRSGVKKMGRGGSFIVPPGYRNDTYPLMVESGEKVIVIPAGQTTNVDRRPIVDVGKFSAINSSISESINRVPQQKLVLNSTLSSDNRSVVRVLNQLGGKMDALNMNLINKKPTQVILITSDPTARVKEDMAIRNRLLRGGLNESELL